MATITTSQYLDSTTTRTAGEAWTIGSGAELTIRTDTRWHAYAPAAMTGSLGSISVNEGKCIIDNNTRWLAITGGSGTCSIGTTITQGGVSGYFLGYWASLTSAPSTTIGATGWIKFREVTGGTFAAGALTGITATASGADLPGWIEIVCDQLATITVPRLGQFYTEGDRFYLDNTNGSVGQVFQIPTNGGGAGTTTLGAFVEKSVGSANANDDYYFWTGLTGATNGWRYDHIGAPQGQTDLRQMFVKNLGNGQFQMGENVEVTGTYAATATIAPTYAGRSESCSYVWVADIITIYNSAGHYCEMGDSIYVDFTSGSATAYDGTYTVIGVPDAYRYQIARTGSGQGGACTVRPGVLFTLTAHGLGIGDQIYVDATSGTLPDGIYTIAAVPATSTFYVKGAFPTALTSGATTTYWGITITTGAVHNLALSNLVQCDFTSGTAVDGNYPICTVPSTTTFTINHPFNGGTGGNVTLKFQVGHVVEAGRRVWVPNIFLRQCTTGARASNVVPHATLVSRPEFTTTSAGAINLNYIYADWYLNLLQAYSVSLRQVIAADTVLIQEIPTEVQLEDVGVGSYFGGGATPLDIQYLPAGIQADRITGFRYSTSAVSAITLNYVSGGEINYPRSGITAYARYNAAQAIMASFSKNVTINNPQIFNSLIQLTTSFGFEINNIDYSDRLTGYTNATTPMSVCSMNGGSDGNSVNGITFGFNGNIPGTQCASTMVACSAVATNNNIRAIGSIAAPLNSTAVFRPNFNSTSAIASFSSGAYLNKLQRVWLSDLRDLYVISSSNTQSNIFESFGIKNPRSLLTYAPMTLTGYESPCVVKGAFTSYVAPAQASVYGWNFADSFTTNSGQIRLMMNEPDAYSASFFTMNSGTAKFNSGGGILMAVIGNQATWTDQYFRKGHTGFEIQECQMTGGTIANYTIEYQLDTGSGFGDWHKWYYQRTVSSGVSGTPTIVLTDSTGVEIGDYAWGTGLNNNTSTVGDAARVINKVGNTLTMDRNNTATVSGTLRFNHLPFETIPDYSVGFKLKARITTITTNTTAITSVSQTTKSTLASQEAALYPLDTTALTVTGVPTNTEIRVRQGSYTLDQRQDVTGGSYTYNYEVNNKPARIQFTLPGYVFEDMDVVLDSTAKSLPVTYAPDPSYIES